MISKLPRWVWVGTWVLAFVAGIINVVGFLGFEHQAVTHLTGTTSMLAAAIASSNEVGILHLSAVMISFIIGAVLSGLIIQDSTLKLGRHYGVALMIEALLLCAAVSMLKRHSSLGYYIASCACGLQNAMVTTYSGAVVRTTHLSGMFTDLGIVIGCVVRGIPVDTRRIRLCLIIISAFLCGGVAGTFGFSHLGYDVLFAPAAIVGTTALSYYIYLTHTPRKRER